MAQCYWPEGATLDRWGHNLLLRIQADPGFRNASKQAQALSLETGMYAPDIDVFRRISSRGLLIVARCPNEFASAYSRAIADGHLEAKAATEKRKSDEYGRIGRYVSDYDLMSIYRMFHTRARERLDSDWDGKRPLDLSNSAESVIAELNLHLLYKIKHGCNDCWFSYFDGIAIPKNPDIGEYFAAFENGQGTFFESKRKLRLFYQIMGMQWIYG